MPTSFVPADTHTVTPHITVSNAAKAIDFYKQAFGAKEIDRSAMPDGRIMHAVLKLGDSKVMLNDEFPEMGGSKGPEPGGKVPFALHIYVEDVDATFDRAVAAGATPIMPVTDMFWGDRYGQLADPFGYRWAVATHKEDVSPEESKRRAAAMFGKKPGQ